jgi:Tfp pilus assembly protein PilO
VTRKHTLLTAVVGVLVVAMWYTMVYKPESKHVASLRSQRTSEQAMVMQLTDQVSTLVREKKQLPATQAALSKLAVVVPPNPDLDTLQTQIHSAAQQAGVAVTQISTSQPSNFGMTANAAAPATSSSGATSGGPSDSAVTVSLSVTGTANAVVNFVANLDALPRLFVVNSFALNTEAGPKVSTEVVAQVFFSKPTSVNEASVGS